jgi:hypothetical protein
MCKELPVILVNKVVDPKRIIGKNGGPWMRRATRGRCKCKGPSSSSFMDVMDTTSWCVEKLGPSPAVPELRREVLPICHFVL